MDKYKIYSKIKRKLNQQTDTVTSVCRGYLQTKTEWNLQPVLVFPDTETNYNRKRNLLKSVTYQYRTQERTYRMPAINPDYSKYFFKITQHSWKSSDFTKFSRGRNWESSYSMKWLLVVRTASILDLNLLQAFTTVSLSRDPTSAFIF